MVREKGSLGVLELINIAANQYIAAIFIFKHINSFNSELNSNNLNYINSFKTKISKA